MHKTVKEKLIAHKYANSGCKTAQNMLLLHLLITQNVIDTVFHYYQEKRGGSA